MLRINLPTPNLNQSPVEGAERCGVDGVKMLRPGIMVYLMLIHIDFYFTFFNIWHLLFSYVMKWQRSMSCSEYISEARIQVNYRRKYQVVKETNLNHFHLICSALPLNCFLYLQNKLYMKIPWPVEISGN